MPPSGYSQEQSRHVAEFLRACAEALSNEAKENRWTLKTAIENELRNIRGYLQRASTTPTQAAILQMTEAFYQKLKASSPVDVHSLRAATAHIAEELQSEVLAIEVPSLP